MLISVLVWLAPSASLFNAVIDSVSTGITMLDRVRRFSWADMTKTPMGNVGSRALVAGGCWAAFVGWLIFLHQDRGQSLRLWKFLKAMLLVIISTAIVLIIATAYFSDRYGYVEVIFSTLLIEVIVVGLIGKYLFPEWFAHNRLLGYLKVISVSFVGLTAIKVAILFFMPGITIRPF